MKGTVLQQYFFAVIWKSYYVVRLILYVVWLTFQLTCQGHKLCLLSLFQDLLFDLWTTTRDQNLLMGALGRFLAKEYTPILHQYPPVCHKIVSAMLQSFKKSNQLMWSFYFPSASSSHSIRKVKQRLDYLKIYWVKFDFIFKKLSPSLLVKWAKRCFLQICSFAIFWTTVIYYKNLSIE